VAARSRITGVKQFFSRHGVLAAAHPQYEFRAGQIEMAEAVAAALEERRALIVEAGTGTGKTLAYLVPAILSGKRIIISTGTKNLQEQLFFKDIPFLQSILSTPIEACYMKGRSNYACRQKIYDAEKEPILTGLEEVNDFNIIREWEKSTEGGDRNELKDLPDSNSVWSKVDARGEMCTGQKCKQYERCFVTQMRVRAQECDIIVVNHHLFFADLAGREQEFGGILPDYAAVVFDEAHELEEVAGQYFGMSLSSHQVEDLRRDTLAVARRKEIHSDGLEDLLNLLSGHASRFFQLFGDGDGRTAFNRQAELLDTCAELYADVLHSLELLSLHLQSLGAGPDEVGPLVRRAEEMRDRLRFWMESGDETYVYWLERRGRGCYLQATPIDVSRILNQRLFDKTPTIVMTSATLAVQGRFDYLRSRLGVPAARELIVPSHFDYQTQALLYVPQHLPDVRSPAFVRTAAEEILRILSHSRGRAFVLFTSYQQMRAVYDRVEPELDYPMLLQGTAPTRALIEEFRETPHCVLFATSAFWQGVDVQGDQLSCVIIDKLPFAVPTDPIVKARCQALERAGGNAFFDYQAPQAAIALKQGFGRLIRSRSDRGVLALLDNRVTRQRYGQVFFDSLPDYAFTTAISEVEAFFDRDA
jgi:ATP-dependent DNA helicase DinG